MTHSHKLAFKGHDHEILLSKKVKILWHSVCLPHNPEVDRSKPPLLKHVFCIIIGLLLTKIDLTKMAWVMIHGEKYQEKLSSVA